MECRNDGARRDDSGTACRARHFAPTCEIRRSSRARYITCGVRPAVPGCKKPASGGIQRPALSAVMCRVRGSGLRPFLIKATGWQHSVRGFLPGVVRTIDRAVYFWKALYKARNAVI